MIFYLIISLWTSGYGQSWSPAMTSQIVPVPYADKASCDTAGKEAQSNFNGGAKVEWTCVPVEKPE